MGNQQGIDMKAITALILCAMLAACGGGEPTVAETMTAAEILETCKAWGVSIRKIDASVADECFRLGFKVPEVQAN